MNADRRLTPVGRQIGLVDDLRWNRLSHTQAEIERALRLLRANRTQGVTLEKHLRRPEVEWRDLVAILPELGSVPLGIAQQVACDVKYSGYVVRQEQQVERQQRLVSKRIPENFDFAAIPHLRTEAREKLTRIRPISLAQAGRISGITPADVALVLAHLEAKRR